jgi:hypothetical protein
LPKTRLVTVSSVLRIFGSALNARREGEMGVSMVGRQKRCGENPDDVAEEVVLGIDRLIVPPNFA